MLGVTTAQEHGVVMQNTHAGKNRGMNIEISLTSVMHTISNRWYFFLYCREEEIETQRVLCVFSLTLTVCL